MDAVPPSSEIGRKLRQIRQARRKSLAVVAGLAGISTSYLSMLELGQRALDRGSVIVALANALEIAPSELTALPVPAPANGDNDRAVHAVSQALMAVHRNRPYGQVVPVEVLRVRVVEVLDGIRSCQMKKIGANLPGLIRDVHTSIAAGRDVAELLDLAVLMHAEGVHSWLAFLGARMEVRALATLAARQASERLDQPVALTLGMWTDALLMLSAGDFALARAELDSVALPTSSRNGLELAGMLGLCRSVVAAAEQRTSDIDSALAYSAELAEQTGETTALGLGFGPTNVGIWSMSATLEAGDHERTVAIAERLDPRVHPYRSRQARYWSDYGRALAHTRGRRDDAVLALRRAEKLSPLHTARNPLVRSVLAELLPHAKRDAVGRELRGMAYRAGLPV